MKSLHRIVVEVEETVVVRSGGYRTIDRCPRCQSDCERTTPWIVVHLRSILLEARNRKPSRLIASVGKFLFSRPPKSGKFSRSRYKAAPIAVGVTPRNRYGGVEKCEEVEPETVGPMELTGSTHLKADAILLRLGCAGETFDSGPERG